MLQFFHTGSLTKYSPDTISAADSSTAPASSDIYGGEREKLEEILRLLLSRVDEIRDVFRAAEDDNDPVEHCLGRIKSDESMREKCRRNNLPETAASALQEIHDAIGIRVVCAFLNDVYMIRDRLLSYDDIELIREKDYIRHAKPNGYRSLHLIVQIPIYLHDQKKLMRVEVQFRTISMDWWASLEHKIRYKKDVVITPEIEKELRECAEISDVLDRRMEMIQQKVESGNS